MNERLDQVYGVMDDTMLMFLENHNTNAPTTSRRILDSILLSRNLVVIHSYAFRTLTPEIPERQSAMQIPQKGAAVLYVIESITAVLFAIILLRRNEQ